MKNVLCSASCDKTRTGIIAAAAVLLAGMTHPAYAAVKTWVGGAEGLWSEGANWNNGTTPVDGDEVELTGAVTVTLAADSARLAAVTVAADAMLVFTNWTTILYATNATVGAAGWITAAGPFTDTMMSNRVHIVCSNILVAANGSIDVNAKGYAGGRQIDANAHGPGRGYGIYYGAGGSHGGMGGAGNGAATLYRLPNYSRPYGDVDAPLFPGSGGGRGVVARATWAARVAARCGSKRKASLQ